MITYKLFQISLVVTIGLPIERDQSYLFQAFREKLKQLRFGISSSF
jgi:hypothetical protein